MKIGVVGLGLIGGSLARALARTPHEVAGFDLNPEAVRRAEELGCISSVLKEEDYGSLDALVLALREGDTLAELDRLAGKLKDGCLVMDICGNKRRIVAKMTELKGIYPKLRFVGTHPMAGREYSGIEHSSPRLFEGAFGVLVPVVDDMQSVELARELYLSIGMRGVKICGAEEHDAMIGYTSQLAHIVSGCYVKNPRSASHCGFSAGSFMDLTRVARLDPDMWTELFLNNADNLYEDLNEIIFRLCEFREALGDGDGERLRALLIEGVRAKELADLSLKEDRDE